MDPLNSSFAGDDDWINTCSVQDREDLTLKLLSTLPRQSLAKFYRNIIAPKLQLDIVGLLPTELALQILSFLPYHGLLTCALVSKRWRQLADDQSVWKALCNAKGWDWKDTPVSSRLSMIPAFLQTPGSQSLTHDDEGVGSEDEVDDSGYVSQTIDYPRAARLSLLPTLPQSPREPKLVPSTRHSVFKSHYPPWIHHPKPDYKLLYNTHILLQNRVRHSNYRLVSLQTRHSRNSHTSTIYCLQLFTLPDGRQVLFTGSRDRSIRQWDLATGAVERVLDQAHDGSVLSLSAHGRYVASAGSDGIVAIWEIATGKLIKRIRDHTDSVLCVRFDGHRLVSCSKDRTVRTYVCPDLTPHLVLASHRAAVNAVALSGKQIVSASGDRSIIVWDAETGDVLQHFEGHHARGIAAIDFAAPLILSGSSDRHLRLIDASTLRGWSTSPSTEPDAQSLPLVPPTCETCGGDLASKKARRRLSKRKQNEAHKDLVRTAVISPDWVLSGSYDQTVKVWDPKTGALVADLSSPAGHSGRIFSVGADCTKIVSCGEDQKICIWDFSHGLDVSFLKL